MKVLRKIGVPVLVVLFLAVGGFYGQDMKPQSRNNITKFITYFCYGQDDTLGTFKRTVTRDKEGSVVEDISTSLDGKKARNNRTGSITYFSYGKDDTLGTFKRAITRDKEGSVIKDISTSLDRKKYRDNRTGVISQIFPKQQEKPGLRVTDVRQVDELEGRTDLPLTGHAAWTFKPSAGRIFVGIEIACTKDGSINGKVSEIVLKQGRDSYLPIGIAPFHLEDFRLFRREDEKSIPSIWKSGSIITTQPTGESVTIGRKDTTQPFEFKLEGVNAKIVVLYEVPLGLQNFQVAICESKPVSIGIKSKRDQKKVK